MLTGGAFAPSRAQGAGAEAIALDVDASDAVQGIVRVHERLPVSAGPLTLVYPKWIPGEHAPNGPIANLAGLHVRAGRTVLPWRRDPVDLFAFHLDVPSGAGALDVDFEYLGAQQGLNSTARFSTPNLFTLTWNKVVLTPAGRDDAAVVLAPSLRLPSPAWRYATALETASANGATLRFRPVSLETLVDSPLDAGINERVFDLGAWDGAPVTLAAFADTPEQLAAGDATVEKLRALVTQMHALYRHRHWNHYTFLLTVSDVMPGQGVEHHQSSDNGTQGKYLTDDDAFAAGADLLAHEFNHSWDGKYRRPFDLATPNLQAPMIDDLLWVYEGMTQFYGDLQAERAGMRTQQQWLDGLALSDASYVTQHGRGWRSLEDTATSSSFLYGARGPWASERRSVDYYGEGELLWLDADVTIRRLTHGARSLDDVARAFFGGAANGTPSVLTYRRADVIAALNDVAPYDWGAFFAQRVDAVAPQPPDPFTPGGYRLVFTEAPSAFETIANERRKQVDLRYSLGLAVGTDGTIADVLPDSVAFRAGVGPGEKIVAMNDRSFGDRKTCDAALRAARDGTPLRLLLTAGNVYRTVALAYRGGPRYPHFERIPGTEDVLGAIAKPLQTTGGP
ncbi:MAG: family peptidase [Candidatus Eremiobacteraeota bacterium]|nr:family peptidase [Candidatus Eremiobacteraeota bacterium]